MAGSTRRAQRGFSLIEALVSVLLVAILGLGMAYATSRVLLIQRYAATQSLAIVQMREYLQTGDLQVSMAGRSLSVSDSPQQGAVTISIAGLSRDITLTRSRSLTVSNAELFSGDGTVSLAY